MSKIKAIALLSGGLDSTLSAKIIQNEGIEVIGVNFYTGLSVIERKRLTGTFRENIYLDTVSQLGIPVEVVDISDGYLDVVLNPEHGYGANANPCMDCKIYMFKKAKELMEKLDAKFIVTGEVLGQRPMSQQYHQLIHIEKESGLKGLVVRPLSQKLLPETIPEKEGWINREHLYDIKGRTRKRQFELANKFGIHIFPQPAGGCCFLTDENYARRFFDFIKTEGKEKFTMDEALLLAFGRHLRIDERTKVIVGRNKEENNLLEKIAHNRVKIFPIDVKGPVTILQGEVNEEKLITACRILGRYSDGKNLPLVKCRIVYPDGRERIVEAPPLPPHSTETMII